MIDGKDEDFDLAAGMRARISASAGVAGDRLFMAAYRSVYALLLNATGAGPG